MSEAVYAIVRVEKVRTGNGAPATAPTTRFTKWAKQHKVEGTKLYHWGNKMYGRYGAVYIRYKFPNSGTYMKFYLTENFREFIVVGCDDDPIVKWNRMNNQYGVLWDFYYKIYRHECTSIRNCTASVREHPSRYFEHPWEITTTSLLEFISDRYWSMLLYNHPLTEEEYRKIHGPFN